MSEQPKRITGFLTVYDFGIGGFFEDRTRADSARGSNGRTAEITELREGESIIGPEERAVIEAAKAQAEAWPEALASLEATTQTSVPFVRWERLAHATEAAVRAMKELEKSQ